MAGEMWLRVASLPLAEEACRMVFGEDTSRGPQALIPAALRGMLPSWPKPLDVPHKVALELPVDFDIDHELGRNERKAVVLIVNRMAVYCGQQLVGHTLRTDELGLNAIKTYWETVEAHRRRLRQAH
jgi:hypothetical protein